MTTATLPAIIVSGGEGDDVILAENAFITAVYEGRASDFRIEMCEDGITVTDLVGDQGCDFLLGVAQLQFDDGIIGLV